MYAEVHDKDPSQMTKGSIEEYEEVIRTLFGRKRGNSLMTQEFQVLKHIFIALAKTSPEVFTHLWTPNGKVLDGSETRWWLVTNRLFGSQWVLKRAIQKSVVDRLNQEAGKKVRFGGVDADVKTNVARGGTFLLQDDIGSKKAMCIPKMPEGCNNWAATYVDLVTPPNQVENNDAPNQARMRFMQAMNVASPLNSSAKLLPCPTKFGSQMKPISLAAGSQFMSPRGMVANCVQKSQARGAKPTSHGLVAAAGS